MSLPDPQFDPALDARLRQVPLPEGLLARLRQIALADDALSDDGLDAALRQVAVPAGLIERLQAALAREAAEPEPAEAAEPMPRPAAGRRLGWVLPWHWATVASLLLALGMSLAGLVLVLVAAFWPLEKPIEPNLPTIVWVPLDDERPLEFSALAGVWSAGQGGYLREPLMPVPAIEWAWEGPPRWDGWWDRAMLLGRWGRANPLLDATPHGWPVLGSDPGVDSLPELKKVADPTPKGIKPPLVPGFPLGQLIRNGINPFVRPALHPKLQSSVVPLGVDTASYELARRYLEDGELPPPDLIRTEELLQAVNYQFPPPKRDVLGLFVAGGPSPFGGEGLTMLQIGVQARPVREEKHQPAHLVLAVDVSASMRWGGRLEMVQRGLRKLLQHLGPDDRLSLVAFSEEARVAIEEAGREDGPSWLAAVASLAAESSTNVGSGLRQAYTLSRHFAIPGTDTTRVVLLTDGTAAMDRGTADAIERRLAEALARGIRLEVIDLGQSLQLDPQLVSLAQIGGGKARRAGTADQICWSLLEIITGRSQLIASDVRMIVNFNPKTVLEYRLLGHEATAIAGVLPDRVETEFCAGQTATAVYEVRLSATGGSDVAAVELGWQPVGGGARRETRRGVARKDFAPLFVQAAPSVQAAALVAEAAEVLRGPRNLRSLQRLGRVLDLAQQIDTQLYQRPSFVEFLEVVEQARKAKPNRGGGRR